MGYLNQIILWSLVVVVLAVIFFLPERGLRARWKQYQLGRQREVLEDTLKYLFDEEQNARHLSAAEIAIRLKLPPTATMKVLERMKHQQLIIQQEDTYQLTSTGKKTAMQIVRAHRLWERYLADEALIPLKDVHQLAHRREHGMTTAQIDALDASLGHPLQDPHGDPIPNASGEFRAVDKSSPLPNWPAGQLLRIVHLEDEPPLAYAQILAVGLQIGQILNVVENNNARIVLSDGVDEYTLAPQVAANVFVDEIKEAVPVGKDTVALGDLADNQKAEIIRLDDQCQGFTRRRFLDLGFTPGTEVYPELQNSFGDPRAYRVRGTLIALRKEQAAQILVRLLPEN